MARREDAPLLFRLKADINQWRWGLRFLYECLPSRAEHNTLQAMRLAEYSRRTLQMMRRETGIQYDHAEAGIAMIHSDPKSFNDAAEAAQLLIRNGERRDVLSVAEAVKVEPALAHTAPSLAGAIYAPNDESGDAYKFLRTGRTGGQAGRISFYGTTIKRIDRVGGEVSGVVVSDAEGERTLSGDAYVVALGPTRRRCCPASALTHWFTPPGYSATLPLRAGSKIPAPKGSITDDEKKVVFTTIGERLRIAGTAELNGFDTSLNTVRCEALTRRAKHHFPDLCEWDRSGLTGCARRRSPTRPSSGSRS